MNRTEAEKQTETFRHGHTCKHYKPYIWNCVLVEEIKTHEWVIEVYLKKSFPNKTFEPPAPPGMKLRFIPYVA